MHESTIVPLGMFAMVAFIVWVKTEGARRRQLQASEFHAKLLERMSSAPEPTQLWWKAQLLRRWDAERRAELPLDVMDVVQIAGAAAAVVLLAWSLPAVLRAFTS